MQPDTNNTDLISMLATSEWFGALPVAELEAIAETARYHWAVSGEVIVEEGEPGDTFFLLTKGQVKVSTRVDGVNHTLTTLSPGQFFGEVAVLNDRPRTATVVADGEVELFVFDKATATRLARQYPAFKLAADSLILARSQDTIQKIVYR